MNTSSLRTLKTTVVLAAATGLMTFGAGAASAHVGVDPASTSEGGFSQLTFRVPNESATAKTFKLTVTLPTETPFTSVSVKPLDGWTAEIKEAALPQPVTSDGATITKAAASVVWTADAAHQISQHEYQTFSISVGRLPKAGTTVMLPAAQAYTDGTVVNWDEAGIAGQEEPKHPAPSFITTAPAGEHGAAATAETTAVSAPSPAAADSTPAAVGWTGLGAGLLGLAAGVTALVRTRKVRES
ncbi:MAG: nuclear export factor [Arthrobacter sp.]|nr:nuclear export factor [Arthrobacter sp.]